MKRILTIALVLAVAFCAFAQGGTEGTAAASNGEITIPSQQLTFGTASAGGAFYPIGTGVAEVISKNVGPLYVTAEITGGSVQNVILVGTGESDMAVSNADHLINGIAGVGQYDKAYDVKAICSLHASILHIVTLPNTGVKSIEDLKGKKVAVGPAGGGSVPAITAVLEAYGMSFDDIIPSYVSYDDGMTQLKDGQVDAALAQAGFPAAAVMSLQATNKVVMLSLSEEAMEKIHEAVPAYSRIVVPAATYGMDSDAIVLGVKNIVYTNSTLSEDTVYLMTKAIYENLEEIKSYHGALKSVTQDQLPEVSDVEYHPGAARYYKEIGVIN